MTIASIRTESAAASFELETGEEGGAIRAYPRSKEFYEKNKDAKRGLFTLPLTVEEGILFRELLRGLVNGVDLMQFGETGTVGATGEQSFAVVSADKTTSFLFTMHEDTKIALRILVEGKLHAGGTYALDAVDKLTLSA